MSDIAEHHRRTEYNRMIELERADAARQALEQAAVRLEQFATNSLYRKALNLGARLIREIKF